MSEKVLIWNLQITEVTGKISLAMFVFCLNKAGKIKSDAKASNERTDQRLNDTKITGNCLRGKVMEISW